MTDACVYGVFESVQGRVDWVSPLAQAFGAHTRIQACAFAGTTDLLLSPRTNPCLDRLPTFYGLLNLILLFSDRNYSVRC